MVRNRTLSQTRSRVSARDSPNTIVRLTVLAPPLMTQICVIFILPCYQEGEDVISARIVPTRQPEVRLGRSFFVSALEVQATGRLRAVNLTSACPISKLQLDQKSTCGTCGMGIGHALHLLTSFQLVCLDCNVPHCCKAVLLNLRKTRPFLYHNHVRILPLGWGKARGAILWPWGSWNEGAQIAAILIRRSAGPVQTMIRSRLRVRHSRRDRAT